MTESEASINFKGSETKRWFSQRRISIFFMCVTVLASVVLDQATKIAAEKHFMVWEDETDLRSYNGRRMHIFSIGEAGSDSENSYFSFNLNYVRNMGAAWGALSSLSDEIRNPFFFVVTLIAVFFIAMFYRSTPKQQWLTRWALLFILSGALGNFLNRLVLGYVIDWIDVNWRILGWQYFFPNFNWADICISVGVVMLMLDSIVFQKKPKTLGAPVVKSA